MIRVVPCRLRKSPDGDRAELTLRAPNADQAVLLYLPLEQARVFAGGCTCPDSQKRGVERCIDRVRLFFAMYPELHPIMCGYGEHPVRDITVYWQRAKRRRKTPA
jgi:hypothetical protein